MADLDPKAIKAVIWVAAAAASVVGGAIGHEAHPFDGLIAKVPDCPCRRVDCTC